MGIQVSPSHIGKVRLPTQWSRAPGCLQQQNLSAIRMCLNGNTTKALFFLVFSRCLSFYSFSLVFPRISLFFLVIPCYSLFFLVLLVFPCFSTFSSYFLVLHNLLWSLVRLIRIKIRTFLAHSALVLNVNRNVCLQN